MPKPGGYIDVDRLQAETTLETAAAKCGVRLDVKGSGPEVRIDCPFQCPGDHVGRKEIAINLDNPQKVWQCHAYQCGCRGNLLTLMHGWLTSAKPTGDKLKGDEFQRVKRVLASTPATQAEASASKEPQVASVAKAPPSPVNVPLEENAEERVRELATIDTKLLREVAGMNPAAAGYVRRHFCLTSESMAKWRCGYLPHDGGGDKRGWSLRGNILYPVLSEHGKVLAWVGRDVQYEQKEREYSQLSPAERSATEPPAKHRFPKGFHRGVELFGQHASRLRHPGYREFITQHGLILVEGFNDVIGLDNLGVPSLGIMSNRMTDAQGEKVQRFAKQLGVRRVNIMFDCEDSGVDGAKEALWFFAERQLDVRLVWSPSMHDGEFKGRQPESLTQADFLRLVEA